MTIVKVQVPLFSTDPDVPALVYAEGGSWMTQQQLHPSTRRQMRDDAKAYFEADYQRGIWKIGKRVGDQPW